ncbi:hypothetical protein O181_100917 [Austropuccinia psidii MF-1]|uniref:Reverse transcriptase/retrotransposon-derived protein RNase H-like domain-containing protein n=1 Tax=Austropuccinia psidii MF-1 TaxID=1389203 RepID=A0A9Q3PHZ9_9BASI|nr:hypothetical protein [Austropuccinia psidii MF-1]
MPDSEPINSYLRNPSAYFMFLVTKSYSEKISSLTSFLKKDSHFPLNKEALREFNYLSNPCLPTIIKTDASHYTLCAVLSQVSDSQNNPIAFDSCKPPPEELNYEILKKELLGIVWALKR